MTCPRCQGLCYGLTLFDHEEAFEQTVCINCGNRMQAQAPVEYLKPWPPRQWMLYPVPVKVLTAIDRTAPTQGHE